MMNDLDVILEIGPKGKRVVATAWDWPGLERSGKTVDAALATLEAYLPRYAKIAERTGLEHGFGQQTSISVIETYDGVGSTDFWGISFASCDLDRQPMPPDEWERRLKVLQACWAEFDNVASRVSSELRKGPRGGGRSRHDIINHVFATERGGFARKIGVTTPEGSMLTPEGLKNHRENVVDALRGYHREGKGAGRAWTLSYLLRHMAYHVLDHSWEMEDKDLSGETLTEIAQ